MEEYIKDSISRAAYTFVETFLAYITVGATITEVDWLTAASVSATAAIYTLLKQLGVGLKENAGVDYLPEDDEYEEGEVDEQC